MIKNWLKIAFINYKKSWLSTIINLLGLSLGLCIFLMVFIHWQDEKSYEQWIPNKENIYLVENSNSVFGNMVVSSYPELSVSKEEFPEIEDFVIANTWKDEQVMLIANGKTAYVNPCRATSNFFEFFPFKIISGSYKNVLNGVEKIAISEETAKLLFGKEYNNCIGKTFGIDGSEKNYPFALNEVAILKQDLSSMISIRASVNNEFLNTYQADGLIIATPTGSTAYSMSVGGPLLVPQAQNLIIAPVASHSLNVRPLIIPDSWYIDLEIDSRSKSFLISLDGRSQVMPQTTKLHIAKANYTIKVIKPLHHSFFKTLKNKLMWGADKRN